ncbi:MAG: acetyltransferase [Desulforegulaceae bacterium]|nr:acetyltransferase [Desulforegulaceae bacterium]
MRRTIYLVGGGGHCVSAIDVIEQEDKYKIGGILDLPEKVGQKVLGYEIIGDDSQIKKYARTDNYFLITMGHIKTSKKRRQLAEMISAFGGRLATIISPSAYVSKHSRVGEGTIVGHSSNISAGVSVGINCIINTKAVIEHNVRLGDYCHISTGAVLNGESRLENGVFLGSNSMVRQDVRIGEGSVIGAGVSVFNDLPSRSYLKFPRQIFYPEDNQK